MTRRKGVRNFADSVRQRLLNLARSTGMRYNLVLQRYAVERFLFRLGASDQVDRFTLKGASLFRVWSTDELRPTKDVDFLADGLEDDASLRAALEAICDVPCPEDGVVLDPETIRIDTIRHEHFHGGQRVRMQGKLGQARLPLQVDIGFGDVITPERQVRDYPTLLDLPVPRIWTYPRETVVAEKLLPVVQMGARNSRVKDLWDIAWLARRFEFHGDTVHSAIAETFRRRGTPFGRARPVALLSDYYEDPLRTKLWNNRLRQFGERADGPATLKDAGKELRRFLGPVCDCLIEKRSFRQVWPAGGPWRRRAQLRTEGGER